MCGAGLRTMDHRNGSAQAPVLVVAAVRQELSFFEAGGKVQALLTGMGPGRAGRAIRRSLAGRDYRLVVSTGFAGGTRPGLRVGDLVIASEVIEVSSGQRRIPSLCPWNGRFLAGPLATVDRPLSDPKKKAEFGAVHGAIAVDMETAAVAAAASEVGVPWLALRAILDPMEVTLSAGSFREAIGLLARPSRWAELTNLMEAIRTAGQSLAGGLQWLVQEPMVCKG